MCSCSADCDPIKHSCSESCYREQHPPHTSTPKERPGGRFLHEGPLGPTHGFWKKPAPDQFLDSWSQVHALEYHSGGLSLTQQTSRALGVTSIAANGEKGKPQPPLQRTIEGAKPGFPALRPQLSLPELGRGRTLQSQAEDAEACETPSPSLDSHL